VNLFLQEILEQPKAFREVLNRYFGKENNLLSKNRIYPKKGYKSIVFTGMGSSYFASHIAANFLNERGISSFVCEAGELLHYNLNGLNKTNLLVAVSQSGETIEIKNIINNLNGKLNIVGITNEEDSFLAANSNILLPIYAGKEAMTTSKTYINTIAVLLLLAFTLTDGMNDKRREELYRLPDFIENFLVDWESKIDRIVQFLGEIPFLNLISRGPSLSSALQGSVILKEGAHIYTEGLPGASFRHGPFEIAGGNHKSIIFAPSGKSSKLNINMACELSALGSSVVLISNEDIDYKNKNLYHLRLDLVEEYLFPILDIIPIELLIVKIAKAKGLEPGELVKGNKVTAKE
jgi:glucosamine--fructose-6-phosphate aminotransferase (isomerizing)